MIIGIIPKRERFCFDVTICVVYMFLCKKMTVIKLINIYQDWFYLRFQAFAFLRWQGKRNPYKFHFYLNNLISIFKWLVISLYFIDLWFSLRCKSHFFQLIINIDSKPKIKKISWSKSIDVYLNFWKSILRWSYRNQAHILCPFDMID